MASINTGDKLEESFRNFPDYPMNLVASRHRYTSDLEIRRKLESTPEIFSPNARPVEFIESWVGDQYPQQSQVVDLAKHSGSNRKDPKTRSIFIPVQCDRAQLNCSAEQLKQILTYHQVMPCFLDMLLTFGQKSAVGSVYGQEDTILEPREQRLEVKSLGRSGSSIQHSFRLRVMDSERSNEGPKWRWSVRQAAVFHAFDTVTGRTVWITATDDPNLTERLGGSLILNDEPLNTDGSASTSLASSLGSTLTTTMEYLHWCEDSWQQYIQYLEDTVRQEADKVVLGELQPLSKSSPFSNHKPVELTDRTLTTLEQLESLGKLKGSIDQALLITKQNELVIDSITSHYNDLLNMREVLDAVNGELRGDIGRFFEQTRPIKTNLRSRQLQLEALGTLAKDRLTLLQDYLSFQATEIRMRQLEIQTARVTSRMRVINLISMVFFPGTFILALFIQNNRQPPINQPPSFQPPPSSTIHSPIRPTSPSIFDNWIFLLASSFIAIVTLTRGVLYLSRRPRARRSIRRIFGHKGARHSAVDLDMAEEMDTRGPQDRRRYGDDVEKTELLGYS